MIIQIIKRTSKRAEFKSLTALLGVTCLLQSCALPTIETREVSVDLPNEYSQTQDKSTKNNIVKDTTEADVNWSAWFADPQLAKIIETAIANNQEIAIMLQRINMAANEVSARKGEYLPFVSAGIEADTEKVGEFTRDGAVEAQLPIRDGREFPDPLGNLRVGLNSSWELDVWKKLRNSAKVASLEYLATIEDRKFFVTELVAEVARTYYELLALDNQLDNLDQTLVVQRNALKTTQELRNYGRSSSLPTARFRAEVSKNESERFVIEQDIVETENKLNLLLGRRPTPIPRDATQLMELSVHQPVVGVPSQLLVNRPDIRQAELELRAAKLDIDVAKANFYPSFTLQAGIGLESFDPKYLFDIPESLAYSIGGDIFAPLINRKAIEAEYKNASAGQIQAAYEYEYTVIKAFIEVSNNLSKLDNLANSFKLKNDQVDALNDSIEVANQLFSSARGEYLEILLAQREALEARSELIDTRKEQMTALVSLYQALGGGWSS